MFDGFAVGVHIPMLEPEQETGELEPAMGKTPTLDEASS